ncbi:WD repeat-containing protein, partial [Reticulomyxa filosa]
SKLPIDNAMERCCFATNESINEMIVFDRNIRLSIRYDEDKNIFKYHKARTYKHFKSFHSSGCVRFNDLILYYLSDNTWLKYEKSVPISLDDCVAVMSEDKNFVHIFGTTDGNANECIHVKTQVNEWIQKETKIEKQWMLKDKELTDIEECKVELKKMKQNPDIKKLKKKKEIEMIIEQWMHLSSVNNIGWIDDFNMIILRYITPTYFKPFKMFENHHGVIGIKFSPDGTKFVSPLLDRTIKIWDVASGKEIQVLKGHLAFVEHAQFSPDGTMVISCSADETIRLWDITSGTEITKLKVHEGTVIRARFSSDGKTIVSCSEDCTIILWDVQSEHPILILEGHRNIKDVQFSPDCQQILSASRDGIISVWNAKSGKRLCTFQLYSYRMKAQFSSDGKYILCSEDSTIQIWDVASGTQVKRLNSDYASGYDAKYFPNKSTILSCLKGSVIQLRDIKFDTITQEIDSGIVFAIDISSDGNTIAFYSKNGTIHLWKVL